jgi:hypothetical protein
MRIRAKADLHYDWGHVAKGDIILVNDRKIDRSIGEPCYVGDGIRLKGKLFKCRMFEVVTTIKIKAKKTMWLGQARIRKGEVIDVTGETENLDGTECYRIGFHQTYQLLPVEDFDLCVPTAAELSEDFVPPPERPVHYANNPNWGRF